MKTINFLAGCILFVFTLFTISSCSNDIEMPNNLKTDRQEQLQKMKLLCSQYGWIQIDGATQKEVDEFLLSVDYEKAKDFFELIKTGGTTINLTDLSQNSTPLRTRAGGIKVHYTLRGSHSSQVATSTTEMNVNYNSEELNVISTKVFSNPASTWTQNDAPTFYFKNNRCDIEVTGTIKWGFIKRDMTMKAFMILYPNSTVVKDGKIYSFRG